jgi:hypothetical protein
VKRPDVQQEIRAYAARLRMFGYPGDAAEVATRLDAWAEALAQRRAVTHGRPVSQRMTPALEQAIWRKHLEDPTKPQHLIARECGVNQGRVSEVLAGKRT